MKALAFAKRNFKEILRDPLTAVFSLGFPLVILILLTAIQKNVPVNMFTLEQLTPGVTVFGLSFVSLFSATLISRDKETAFLLRLYTSPLSATDFILGYTLPMLPISLMQAAITYIAAIFLGLEITVKILLALLFLVPIALLFIGLGLLFGSILNVKQVGGICGAALTNLTAWFSGTWFDLELVGGAFKKIAYFLPFVHAVELEKAALNGNLSDIFPHLYWVIGYALITLSAAIFIFLKQMKK